MASKKEKVEKKKIKAKYKARKKGLEAQYELDKEMAKLGVPAETAARKAEEPWYKDPGWVRAIVATAGLIITILVIIFSLSK